MNVEQIRALRLADPFEPFRMVMDDGRHLDINRSYDLGISGNGKHMICSTDDGGWERIDPARVQNVMPLRARPNRRRTRRTGGR